MPTAYGDLTAVILALLALAERPEMESPFGDTDRSGSSISWGSLDLIYANIATFRDHVDPVQLGTSYLALSGRERSGDGGHPHLDLCLPPEPAPERRRTQSSCARDRTTERVMNRTRLSLHYLHSYFDPDRPRPPVLSEKGPWTAACPMATMETSCRGLPACSWRASE